MTDAASAPARKNGCHNREPFQSAVLVQDGHYTKPMGAADGAERTARMVQVPFRMAQDCRYTHTALGKADAACAGCTWRTPA